MLLSFQRCSLMKRLLLTGPIHRVHTNLLGKERENINMKTTSSGNPRNPPLQKLCNFHIVHLHKHHMPISPDPMLHQSQPLHVFYARLPKELYRAAVVRGMIARLTSDDNNSRIEQIHQSPRRLLLQNPWLRLGLIARRRRCSNPLLTQRSVISRLGRRVVRDRYISDPVRLSRRSLQSLTGKWRTTRVDSDDCFHEFGPRVSD